MGKAAQLIGLFDPNPVNNDKQVQYGNSRRL